MICILMIFEYCGWNLKFFLGNNWMLGNDFLVRVIVVVDY